MHLSLADLGGGGRAHHIPPLQDPILLFLHTILAKSACARGPRPPNRSMPPYGKSWICHSLLDKEPYLYSSELHNVKLHYVSKLWSDEHNLDVN